MPIQDEGLPEPNSFLSNVVRPKAIEMANAEVVKVKNKAPRVGRSAGVLFNFDSSSEVMKSAKELQSMALQQPFVISPRNTGKCLLKKQTYAAMS